MSTISKSKNIHKFKGFDVGTNENENLIADNSANALNFDVKKLALFIKFDDDDEIETMKSMGTEFTIGLLPGSHLEFTDSKGKSFKMTCRSV